MPNFKTRKSLYLCREGFEFYLCNDWEVYSRRLLFIYLFLTNGTPLQGWDELTPLIVPRPNHLMGACKKKTPYYVLD